MSKQKEIDYAQKAAELEKATLSIEEEKRQKRFEREEKKFLKAHAKKSQSLQRLVAPLLFVITILISYLVWLFSR